jgi:hypothetical protein
VRFSSALKLASFEELIQRLDRSCVSEDTIAKEAFHAAVPDDHSNAGGEPERRMAG